MTVGHSTFANTIADLIGAILCTADATTGRRSVPAKNRPRSSRR